MYSSFIFPTKSSRLQILPASSLPPSEKGDATSLWSSSSRLETWEIPGKTMGKPWENGGKPGKNIGKPWENHRKMAESLHELRRLA